MCYSMLSAGMNLLCSKAFKNSENSKFCDVGNSTLDPESMWYFGIIHLSDIERIQNTQIVF